MHTVFDNMDQINTRPEVWAGIECTVNRVENYYFDQLTYAGHYSRQGDIDQFAELGIKKFFSLPGFMGNTSTFLRSKAQLQLDNKTICKNKIPRHGTNCRIIASRQRPAIYKSS